MYKIHKNRPKKKYDLVVRGVPFGGHVNGKDSDGEFFHADTKVSSHPIPILYAHGTQIDSTESKKGEIYGITEDIWEEGDGFYYGVKIFDDAEVEDDSGIKYKAKDYLRESADMGMLFSSIGSLHGAGLDVDRATGAINKVVVAELSLIDKRLTPTISPKNYYAVAKTKARENYIKAGIIDESEKIDGACKCGCGLNSDSLFDDGVTKCDACSDEQPCQKCDDKKKCSDTKPKGETMSLLAKLKALIDGKKDGEELTAEEVQTALKAGQSTTIVTSTDNIDEVVRNAVTKATETLSATFNSKIDELQKSFTGEVAVMKATQESNAFNKYLGTMLNTKLNADEVAQYQAVYASLEGVASDVREKTVATLKAQIEAKTPIADLFAKGVTVLSEEEKDTQSEEYAFAASVAMKAGQDVFGTNKEANASLAEIAKKALEAVNGGAK